MLIGNGQTYAKNDFYDFCHYVVSLINKVVKFPKFDLETGSQETSTISLNIGGLTL